MNPVEYVENVLRSESPKFSNPNPRLLHSIMGCCTESGELMDILKKYIYYGKKIDKLALIEEVGDVLWYLGIMVDELGVSFEEVMRLNICKLKKRYPEKFESDRALNRDLDSERIELERGEN